MIGINYKLNTPTMIMIKKNAVLLPLSVFVNRLLQTSLFVLTGEEDNPLLYHPIRIPFFFVNYGSSEFARIYIYSAMSLFYDYTYFFMVIYRHDNDFLVFDYLSFKKQRSFGGL